MSGDGSNASTPPTDSNPADVALGNLVQFSGEGVSIAIDRGDVYAFYPKANADIAYGCYLPPERGWTPPRG